MMIEVLTDLAERLCSHDDPRLYREADELMQEAAVEITRLRAEIASERAAALEEAAVICRNRVGIVGTSGRRFEAWDCAAAIRAAITKGAKPA